MKRLVILGGGFAGATLARRIVGRTPADWDVVLVSEESYTTFNPMLPEVVGASIFPEHVIVPLRHILGRCPRARFIMGEARAIDRAGRTLQLDTLAGPLTLGYDTLVLALGSRARLDLLPGMAAHALPLKTIGDAMHLRNVALRRLAAMELEADEARRRLLGHVVVIGGGFSGVEVAGALADYLHGALRYYPRLRSGDIRVSLLHDGDRLLPELHASLGDRALSILRRDDVAVHLKTRALAIRADGVDLDDGTSLAAATVVATIGTMPNPLIGALGLECERGRLRVNADLSVTGDDALWALGDCAIAMNQRDGSVSPPTAQFAVRQAHCLADNLLARMRDRPTRGFSYRPRGAMAAIGRLNGVADVFGIRLAGLPAWLAWRAYYLAQVPTLSRKLRLFVEWTWEMLFAADVTHLHFRRSGEPNALLEAAATGRPAMTVD